MPSGDELYQYLIGKTPLSLVQEPFDSYSRITDIMGGGIDNNIRINTMPPGPAANAYQINYRMTADGLYYKAEVEWNKFIPWLVQNIQPWQLSHRSRFIALASNQLQIRELDRRIEQAEATKADIAKMALTESQSQELASMLLEKTKKYMKFNPLWIKSYIDEHTESSMGEGRKWYMAYAMDRSQWRDLFEIYKHNLELMEEHLGWSNQVPWNVGIRARSDEITEVTRYYDWRLMERSRIILFHPSMNMLTVFIPQKAAYYTEVLAATIDAVHAIPEYHYPYLEGGKIYLTAQKLFIDEPQLFHAYDGKRWDTTVGGLLGKAFRSWMIHVKGFDMLPTGTSVTSLLDTMANIVATRRLDGKMISLGDDINHWGKAKLNVPYIEFQPDDTKHKYLLGVCYDPDVNRPRISGMKMTMDRARAMKPLPAKFETEGSAIVSRSRDNRTRVAWAGLMFGEFGNRSLLESIAKMKPSEHLSPTEYIESLIEEQYSSEDVYAWAESKGVKNIFL